MIVQYTTNSGRNASGTPVEGRFPHIVIQDDLTGETVSVSWSPNTGWVQDAS